MLRARTMEVVTTNNHNQAHHHHQQQQQQHHHHHLAPHHHHHHSNNSGSGTRSPFQREVREWQRIDPETGALLSGRLEADRWINGPLNSYGKISDSQNISKPNGTQHTQRKQLEVLQSRTANGAMQVIRSQTVQTTSSRWSSSPTSPTPITTTSPPPYTAPLLASFTNCSNNNDSTHNPYHNHNSNQSNQSNHDPSNKQFHKPPHLTEFSTLPLFSLTASSPQTTVTPTTPPPLTTAPSHLLSPPQSQWTESLPTSGVEITEANGEHIVDNDHDDDDADVVGVVSGGLGYIVDDGETEEDFVINSSSSTIHSYNNNDDISNAKTFYQRLNSNSSLADTAPSFKLSNLMKSSSSASSSSNHSLTKAAAATTAAAASSATTTTMNNTHRLPSKISLHAIVGNNNNISNSGNNTTTGTGTTTTSNAFNANPTALPAWQQQLRRRSSLFEQSDLFGSHSSSTVSSSTSNGSNINLNNLNNSHRVGGEANGAGGVVSKSKQNRHIDYDHSDYGVAAADHDEAALPRHKRNQNIELTPTPANRQMRHDLESFQQHNSTTNTIEDQLRQRLHIRQHSRESNEANDDCDDLRLSSRHLRRQQIPHESESASDISLQRLRSISTDDLSSEWNSQTDPTTGEETPADWRRVSKLRRSFQLSNKSEKTQTSATSATTRTRPADLPVTLGNVAKIRADLESKRRELLASSAITAATSSPMNEQTTDESDDIAEIKPSKATKRSTFLTAETLQQIRGNLKQLSDESLYKDDLWALRKPNYEQQKLQLPPLQKPAIFERKLRQITPEKSPEIVPSPKSAFQVVAQRTAVAAPTNKTHSLESRQKLKDTSSAEWHFRRKSYGFEKMSPPEDRVMFRMDASTDSGLGRSGELSNWSPTESTPHQKLQQRSTIIQFGDAGGSKLRQAGRYQSPTDSEADDYNKRHSIAVDESHYMRKATQVHINGDGKGSIVEHSSSTSNALFQRKRVEFCKTEVHFAAESGRVNIVETDGKPPPTNNFRRRRRVTSGPLESLVKGAAVTSTNVAATTSDDQLSRHRTISQTTVAYKATLVDTPSDSGLSNTTLSNATKAAPQLSYTQAKTENLRSTNYATNNAIDTTDNDHDAAIRGILKNKPIKPKPYHLGENIEKPTDLWNGQQAKKFTTVNDAPLLGEYKLNKVVADQTDYPLPATKSNSFSTKINVSLGDTSARHEIENGLSTKQIQRHHQQQRLNSTTTNVQDLLLEDLREHQRILDEGLKSTSLIIKTMRSANEFDEAMRRLSIASIESGTVPVQIVVPTPILRSLSYQEPNNATARRYSTTSLNSADQHSTTLYKSASYSSTMSIASAIRRYSSDSYCSSSSVPNTPNTTTTTSFQFSGNTVSQQLSQLRRMYDVQEDDSADEEVKSYFMRGGGGFHDSNNNSDSGGGTQESSFEDEQLTESTNSWSRLKFKNTNWRHNEVESKHKMTANCIGIEQGKSSNVMSISLHSPQAANKPVEQPKLITQVPVAKPRSFTSALRTVQPQVEVAQTVRQTDMPTSPIKLPKDSLKIIKEARGARKLREHELSYFGVPVSTDAQAESQRHQHDRTTHDTTTTQHKTLISTQQTNDNYNERQTTNWNKVNTNQNENRTSSDLHETKHIRPAVRKSLQKRHQQQNALEEHDENDDDDQHFYENIANELKPPIFKVRSSTPHDEDERYDRKTDVQRDAMILSEMTHNADQTLKSISDEAALKDQRRQRRHSLQRQHHSRPLETIDEKIFVEKINDKCIAVNVARGTFASESRRTSRHSTPSPNNRGRSSSQSSIECPRARSRSRSLSSERDYENAPVKPNRASSSTQASRQRLLTTAKVAANKQQQNSRSSSLDSQKSQRSQQNSSDDELRARRFRSRQRTTTTKQEKYDSSAERKLSKPKTEKLRGHSQQQQQTSASSTMRSIRTERNKCLHTGDVAASKQKQESHSQRTPTSSTIIHNQHSQIRRQRHADDAAPHGHSSGSSSKHRSKTSAEHHHHHDQPTRSSREKDSSLTRSTRLGRSSKLTQDVGQRSTNRSESEKDKLTRSSGHSSRSSHAHSGHNDRVHNTTTTTTNAGSSNTPLTARKRSSNKNDSNSSKHTVATDKITSSKNTVAALPNSQRHEQSQQYHQHPVHVHKITAATAVASKHHREHHRSGKDRK